MPSRTLASDAKIHVSSLTDLHTHFDDLYDDLHSPETEHTWQKIERALLHIQAITRGGATKYPEFVSLLKDASSPICNALLSERTKLSGTAGDLLNSIAPRMAERFDPLVSVFVPTLLLICARTNKVAVKRAEKSLHFIVKHCRPPAVVGYLKEAIRDKGQGLRAVAAATLVVVLDNTEKERLQRRVADIEGCIKSGATDSNVEVRQTTKVIFERYVGMWPERVEGFTKPMTPTIRRYLSLPKTGPLVVDVPALTESFKVSRAPQVAQTSRQDELPVAPQQVPASRPQPAYNFFPDLPKSTSASSSRNTLNDASYNKRGLFAEQIAAARNARLARMPSFNDLPKTDTIKRQPSFDQLRPQAAAPAAPGTTFRVPRFDVVVAPPPARQDSADRVREAFTHGDINATTPSFAAASGLHGKSALLAAYKQAFEGGSSSKPSSSRKDKEKSSKHGEKRREKTVAVRFEPHSDDKNDAAGEPLHRSKSAPSIAIAADEGNANWVDSDEEQPSTPERVTMHTQTPRTGVKATRVPAQRVVVPQSAAKVGAMRVVVQTPKVAPGRVALEVESSPVPKARIASAAGETVEGDAKEEEAVVEKKDEQKKDEMVEKAEAKENEKETAPEKQKEKVQEKPPAAIVKRAAATATTAKQPSKPAVTAKAAAPSAPSASAKARMQAKGAARPAAGTAAAASGEARKVAPKTVSTAAKPTVVRKPVSSSATTASKPVAKPAAAAAAATASVRAKPGPPTKPVSTAKSSTSAAPSTATTTRSKPVSTAKATTNAAPAAPAPAAAPAAKRTSTLLASTASTRNKIVPSAAVKKFQPKPSSLAKGVGGVQKKSSIAVGLKGRPAGGVAKKEEVVKRAAASAVKVIERGRRVSLVAGGGGGGKKEVNEVVEMGVEVKEGEGVVVVVMEEEGEAREKEAEMEDAQQENTQQDVKVAEEVAEVESDQVVDVEAEPLVEAEPVVEVEPVVEAEPIVEATTEQENISRAVTEDDTSKSHSEAQEESTPADEEPASPALAAVSTPAKMPSLTDTPAKPRTPLGNKDTNLPRSTPLASATKAKSSPLLSATRVRASPARISASSPLRRSTPHKEVDMSSSFEESESQDEGEEEEQVVQLHFAKVASKQLVVGLESEDGSVVGEGDETVLLDHAV